MSMMEVVDWVAEAFRRRPMRDDAGRPIRVAPMEVVSKDRFIRRWESRLRRIRRMRSFLKATKIAARRRKRLASAEAQIAQLIYFVKIYAPYTHLDCRFVDDQLCSLLRSIIIIAMIPYVATSITAFQPCVAAASMGPTEPGGIVSYGIGRRSINT